MYYTRKNPHFDASIIDVYLILFIIGHIYFLAKETRLLKNLILDCY